MGMRRIRPFSERSGDRPEPFAVGISLKEALGKTLDGTSDSGAALVIVGDAGLRTLLGALSGMA